VQNVNIGLKSVFSMSGELRRWTGV